MNDGKLKSLSEYILASNTDLYNKDFLLTWEKSVEEITNIVNVAK